MQTCGGGAEDNDKIRAVFLSPSAEVVVRAAAWGITRRTLDSQ